VAVEEPERRRRGVPWKVVVPIVLVAALAGLGVLAYRLFSTPSYEVPVLTGVPQAEALAQIEGNGWEVSVQTERSDDEPRVDHVVRTAPPAGADLAEGEPFLLVVSEGPVLRSLPELTGLTLAEAQAQLLALDLVVAPVEQYDEDVPPGQVIGWSVPEQPDLVAGGQVEPGTEVEVVSSLGPAPRTVPTLTGTTFAEAQAAVEPLALAVTEIEQVFSDTVPAGVIVTQVPAAGDEVDRGTTIQVTVSKGPDVVTLPDLAGTTYDEAATLLAEAGFVPVLSLGSTDGTFVSASVGGEPTAAGDVHPRGTQVDLVFL
jgi:serine/threonine-protein kinase